MKVAESLRAFLSDAIVPVYGRILLTVFVPVLGVIWFIGGVGLLLALLPVLAGIAVGIPLFVFPIYLWFTRSRNAWARFAEVRGLSVSGLGGGETPVITGVFEDRPVQLSFVPTAELRVNGARTTVGVTRASVGLLAEPFANPRATEVFGAMRRIHGDRIAVVGRELVLVRSELVTTEAELEALLSECRNFAEQLDAAQ